MSTAAIAERLRFMDLGAEAQDRIRGLKPIIASALPDALDLFYAQVRSFPETRRLFQGDGHMADAKSRQLSHWDAISSGRFDEGYVRAVTAVGRVHARIGLEPRWYIGGYAILLERLIAQVLEARWPKSGWRSRGPGARRTAGEIGALVKAALLDIDLAISVYLEAAEDARKATEAQVLARERETVVESVGQAMSALSGGDLTYRMPDAIPPEYAQLRVDFNAAMQELQATMKVIASAADALRSGSDEISQASDDLSRRTEQQAASLEQTAAALDEVTVTVKRSADGARQATASASAAQAEAARSGEVMGDAVAAMGEIEDSSGKIGQIIGVIDEIAFQTSLLALNAGVEAARAGEAGRGFAVVAQEVRALAQRAADAAKEIKALIVGSREQVQRGVRLVGDTGRALGDIVEKVAAIDGLISAISTSAQEQATGLGEVNTAVNQMDQVTQQNAAMVEQTTAAAARLKSEAAELARLVSRFRIGDHAVASVRSEPGEAGRRRSGPAAVARAPARIPPPRHPPGSAAAAAQWDEF